VKTLIVCLIALFTIHPLTASAQVPPDAQLWRTFAEKLDVGTRITVRLHDGRRVSATLVQAGTDALLLQPRTRVPVPVQPVPYDAIASIEREHGGVSGAKAAAIGVASGAATFAAIFLILLATFD
jgi:hypothetical protein